MLLGDLLSLLYNTSAYGFAVWAYRVQLWRYTSLARRGNLWISAPAGDCLTGTASIDRRIRPPAVDMVATGIDKHTGWLLIPQ